jgi:hypothetical protein
MEKPIPEGATHTRDGDYYKVGHKVQCLEFGKYGEWVDCNEPFEIAWWLDDLTPISNDA